MPKAMLVSETGGPEVMRPAETQPRQPGPGQLLVDVAASGVNYIDTYQRAGIYPVPLPFIPGLEGAGTVAAIGPEAGEFAVGDRVAWASAPGSYAEQVLVEGNQAVAVPDGVSDDIAAAVPLQGFTAHYLVASTYPVKPGDAVLVHAAAGGVGLLLVQLATARGARVIATASTGEKRELALAAGAAEAIDYDGFADKVRALTGGEGVAAVYDGVGKSTFDGSLASLRPRGTMVLFGGSSGQVPPFDLQRLNSGGSLFITRPTLAHYTATRQELAWRATEVFGAVADGSLDVRIGGRYPLNQAAQAHEDLQSRRTTGKLLLVNGGD